MKIKRMEYSRIKNLGNYETERFGIEVDLDEEEQKDPKKVFTRMRKFVVDMLHEKERERRV